MQTLREKSILQMDDIFYGAIEFQNNEWLTIIY
jgi:hypothetical protein